MRSVFTVSEGTVSDRVSDTVNDRVNKGISEGVKSRMLKLVFAIMNKPLQKADELAAEII